MNTARTTLGWLLLAIVVIVPTGAATFSPLLQWREPIYIAAGFAGIIGLTLLLLQPLLANAYLPGINAHRSRRLHRSVGVALLCSVILHVVGLWITSPPDVIDALLFVSPTPFSQWGVIAMWAVFATAGLAMVRRRLTLSPLAWRTGHKILAVIIVGGSVAHAMLVEGTMEFFSKSALCILLVSATFLILLKSPKARQ